MLVAATVGRPSKISLDVVVYDQRITHRGMFNQVS